MHTTLNEAGLYTHVTHIFWLIAASRVQHQAAPPRREELQSHTPTVSTSTNTVEPSSRTVDTPQADAPVPDQTVMRRLPSRASKRAIVRPPMMNERVRRFQPEVTAYTRSDERVYVSQDAIVPESSTTCSSSRTSSGYTGGVGYRGSAGYRGSVGFTSKYGGNRHNWSTTKVSVPDRYYIYLYMLYI